MRKELLLPNEYQTERFGEEINVLLLPGFESRNPVNNNCVFKLNK
jgi:hypothetical protein